MALEKADFGRGRPEASFLMVSCWPRADIAMKHNIGSKEYLGSSKCAIIDNVGIVHGDRRGQMRQKEMVTSESVIATGQLLS